MIKFLPVLLQSVVADHCKSYVSISDLVTNEQCQAKCTTSHDCVLLEDIPNDEDIANAEELNYESQSAVVLTDTPYDEDIANSEELNYESQSAATPSLRSSTRSTSPYGPWDYELLPLECGFGYVMDVDTNIGTANKLYKISTDGTYSDILSEELSFEEGLRGGIGFDKATGALFGLANPTSGGHEVFALGYGQDGSTIELRKYNVKTTDGSILSAEAACDVFNPEDGSAGYYTCCTSRYQCGFFRLSDTKGPADHFVWDKFNHTQGALITGIGDINFVPADTDPTNARFCGVNKGSDVTMCSANFETKELRCWNSGWIFLSEMRLTGFVGASAYINSEFNMVVHDLKGTGIVVPFQDGSTVQPGMGYSTFSLPSSMGEFDGASCDTNTTTTTTSQNLNITWIHKPPVHITTTTTPTNIQEPESNVGVVVGSAIGGLVVLAAAIAGGIFVGKNRRDSLRFSEELEQFA